LCWQSKLVVVAALAAMAAAAQPVRGASAAEADFFVSLGYEVDGSLRRCWDEAEFRRSVALRVGYDPFRDGASVSVSIHVGGSERAVNGHVDWRNANGVGMGERRFVAQDGNCLKLLTEMSFAVGLQIELLRPPAPAGTGAASPAGGGPASSASTPVPTTVAAQPTSTLTLAAPPPVAPEREVAKLEKERLPSDDAGAQPIPASPASSRWPMWLGIGPSLAWGIAPSVTGSARLFLGVRPGDLSLEVGGEASLPSTERQWDGSGFRQTLLGASAALCGHRQALSACALGKASQVRVTGLGVDHPRSPTGVAAHMGLRLAAALQLGGPWFATAHLDTLALLTPFTVSLSQAGVWEMPRLGAMAGIDVWARFR
jgi:hypothetical protein